MSADQDQRSPAIGLDIGTSRIVMAQREGEQYRFDSQLNAFVSVPFSKMTEKALRKEGLPVTRSNGELMVYGDESEKFANLLGLETRRPMTGGVLNLSETVSTDVIERIVTALLGEKDGDGRLLYFTVPAVPAGSEESLTYHETTLKELLTARGYQVKSINEGLAVVYGELEDSNYSGIGVSCGGGLCNVCLSYLSVPVVSFSVPKAGDFIDSNAASVTGDRATRIRAEKETSFRFNGSFPDKVHRALGVYYDDMIHAVVDTMKEVFTTANDAPRFTGALPLVLSGGTSMPKGFAGRFEKILRESDFPVEISEVRQADDPLYSTARGALTAALTEL